MNGIPGTLGLLIVDDHSEWVRQLTFLINQALPEKDGKPQSVVRWEKTLETGILAVPDFQPDTIILDLTFPNSSPEETLAILPRFFIPNHPNPYHPSIVIMSSHIHPDNPLKGELALDCIIAGAEKAYAKDEVSVRRMVSDCVWDHVRSTVRRKQHPELDYRTF